jgi:multidrug efflux pump subunit AcrB
LATQPSQKKVNKMWLTRVSISQPVFATMVMVALCVLGLFSYQRLGVESMPEISVPGLWVEYSYPGASPEAVEREITKLVEENLNSVTGVKRITSRSFEGRSQTNVDFNLNSNMDRVMQEVRDRLSLLQGGLPKDVRSPIVGRYSGDDNASVVQMVLMSKTRSIRELSVIADRDIQKRLVRIEGVARINVWGLNSREVRVDLKPERLRAYAITPSEIASALREVNSDQPVGLLNGPVDETLVRVEGRTGQASDLGKVVVARRNGLMLTLADLSDINERERETASASRIDGQQSIELSVAKQQDANVVAVGDAVHQAIAQVRKGLPADVELRVMFANSDWVKDSLTGLKRTLIEGALLTIFVVFLFLKSWRSTIITGLTLPIAVIGSFIAVDLFGFTLNFMTMMALSLCIGLLIDDAIVVRENIVRHLAMGKDHLRAAREGTEEIGLAVMATTFAICAVFVPIAFMSGIVGKFFYPFGITIAVAVLISLFVSFTLDPMLSSRWPDKPMDPARWPVIGSLFKIVDKSMDWLHRTYERIIRWVFSANRYRLFVPPIPAYGKPFAAQTGLRLKQEQRLFRFATITPRGLISLGALLCFVTSLVLATQLGSEFVPQTDQGFTSIQIRTPVGSSLERTNEKARQIEERLRKIDAIESISVNIGGGSGRNSGNLNLKLKDRKLRTQSQKQVEELVRKSIADIAGIESTIGWNRPIYVALLGSDSALLAKTTAEFGEAVKKIKGIADVELSVKPGIPTFAIRVNASANKELGLTSAQLAATLRAYVAGETATSYSASDGEQIDVILRLPEQQRQRVEQLRDLPVAFTKDGQAVPLSRVATIVSVESPDVIRRQNLQRREAVFAGVEGRFAGDVGGEVEKLTKSFALPPGITFDVGGATKEQNEAFSALLASLGLAVIFIYLVLASQFGSFLQPIAIMASLPLSLIGVVLALLLTGSSLNLFSMIGLILLMGLVTKNAILLVDYANQMRREKGATVAQALIEAGQVRMRPIMMTTSAMVFGMLPLALAIHPGSEIQSPMGKAILGGIITSTFLTLIVVPVIYSYLVRDKNR